MLRRMKVSKTAVRLGSAVYPSNRSQINKRCSPSISNIIYRHLRQMNFIFDYRYATVLYYLNDVKHGGETAFPVVDEITFDKQVG